MSTHLLHDLFVSVGTSAALVFLLGIIFIPLAELFPSRPSQPAFRRDMIIDLLYYFCLPIIYLPASALFSHVFHGALDLANSSAPANAGIFPSLAAWPIWAQFLTIVIVTDFLQYWMHRLFHKRRLWKFHSIHHSSKNVDWLSSTRWHPVNYVIFITLIKEVVDIFGFKPEVFIWVTFAYTVNACLVHANLNWTYGPLRYVLASPVFHRWHHTSPAEGGDKNFAPYFSFFDLMFGTFYMPKNKQPKVFGAPYDPMPENFVGQLAYPFTSGIRRQGKRGARQGG